LKLLAIVIVSSILLTNAAWADKPRMEDIASKLACYCGNCPHLVVSACGCSVADQIQADIQKMIDTGQSEDQIIQGYVAKHGQTVLAAPTKSGFNLTAWAIPFFAFFIGGVLLFTYLKKQRNLPSTPVENTAEVWDDQESHYRDLLKKELEERK
jgi:cytochrome c-type biogenesis protein CcmH/NrfF